MRLHPAALCLLLWLIPFYSFSQESESGLDKVANFPSRLLDKINNKTNDLNRQLTMQTEKYVRLLEKREARLKKRLFRLDSARAAQLYASDPEQGYAALLQKLKRDSTRMCTSMGPEYLPNVDSLNVALAFLNKNPQLMASAKIPASDVQGSLGSLNQLEAQLQDADMIKQYVQSRRDQIQQMLGQYSHLPAGVTDAFGAYKKEGYYYADQVRQYRQLLNDPDKMLQTALALLSKLPAFSGFMRSNSFLSGLFSVPGNYGTPDGMVGLQTRDQVLGLIQSQVGQGGGSAAASIQQSLSSAQQDLSAVQNKLSSLGSGSGDMDMPDFKPNDQKKKTLFKRLEYGVNIQTTHASNYFPSYTDFGLSLGYNLGHSNTIGIGASYKLGWGSGYDHISMSNQGAGLRSFIDIQVKKGFGLSGGFEMNYLLPFAHFRDISSLTGWTQSGLIGISKTVSIKSPVFKKTQLQLLWDFLSYQQIPRTQPIIFRVGYSF
jgi:hypothetical protein